MKKEASVYASYANQKVLGATPAELTLMLYDGAIKFCNIAESAIEKKEIEILLIQDSKDRWTIPKGHIEKGETAQETAKREIGEEAGLHDVKIIGWLGKINFRYRRIDKLVLMTTQVFLVKALGDTDAIQKEDWMNGIKWFSFSDALEEIEYEDIGKLILLAMKKIRQEKL